MACSDNVVRAGLTIKHKDKETLCQMLTYNMDTPSRNKFPARPHPLDSCVQVYDPPTPEFAVNRISIPKGTEEVSLTPVGGGWRVLVNVSVRFGECCISTRSIARCVCVCVCVCVCCVCLCVCMSGCYYLY